MSSENSEAEKSVSDDAPLVEAAIAGDKDAFGTLIERYQDRLYNTLLRVLSSREDASDVVQDAFVQAYVKLDTFRGASKFYTWLYRIAMNLALSHRRRRKATVSVEEIQERAGHQVADPQAGPEGVLATRERSQIVHAALESLGQQHRQILVLRELEGCSYETIAEILEMPVGTVRSRLHRARMQLRDQLKEVLPEEAG